MICLDKVLFPYFPTFLKIEHRARDFVSSNLNQKIGQQFKAFKLYQNNPLEPAGENDYVLKQSKKHEHHPPSTVSR